LGFPLALAPGDAGTDGLDDPEPAGVAAPEGSPDRLAVGLGLAAVPPPAAPCALPEWALPFEPPLRPPLF
jgi:hypothetical protein